MPKDAPGIPAGLTAYGGMQQEFEAHFSMLGNGISFVSYDVDRAAQPVRHLPARAAGDAGDHLDGARPGCRCELSLAHADQMTFEGFDPDGGDLTA